MGAKYVVSIKWLDEPEAQDYVAADSYLSLLLGPERAAATVALLRTAAPAQHPPKDLLRAAGLGLLPLDDTEVARDLKKVKKGRLLSPVLLVRVRVGGGALIVADGYHRICAAYRVDEDGPVPTRIADLVHS